MGVPDQRFKAYCVTIGTRVTFLGRKFGRFQWRPSNLHGSARRRIDRRVGADSSRSPYCACVTPAAGITFAAQKEG